ncbi:hypothetical protein J7E52_19995 [Bacillus sp. ISL-34]|uniref:hypothetical protein n=1 Tax=Bacillus sp. ISL-34 TaxID=2819121 RepID=UPI001BE8C369|nr:hypothetical protein [Bacillus sp. ISL-34]
MQKSLSKKLSSQNMVSLGFLAQIRKFLEAFPYFSQLCGFSHLPHLATFAGIATWFREEGYEAIHFETLQKMGLRQPLVVMIDSTALRRSLYDSQAAKGISTRFSWYTGYKLHLCFRIRHM